MPYAKTAITSLQIITTIVFGFVILPRLQVAGGLTLIIGAIAWSIFCLGIFTIARPLTAFFQSQLEISTISLTDWANNTSMKNLNTSVAVSAALLLFLELALIRWQASLFPAFALYKNFTLLACFCGLGIGFALAKKAPLLILGSLPLLAANLLLLTLLRYGTLEITLNMLSVVPVNEETAVTGGFLMKGSLVERLIFYFPIYLLLFSTFTLNVLTLLPIGQLCGFLMERTKPLTGYGLNLIGSIIGVVLLFILSWLWIGPVIWFGLSAVLILWLIPHVNKTAIISAFIIIAVCAWPTEKLVQNIYSPYQLIQKVTKEDGFMKILASGTYYQKVFDFSKVPEDKKTQLTYAYYELPFRTAPSLERVAIVGAGSGNDVAAALRNNAAKVDAVEIDPAIRDLGKLNHPEHPYSNPHTNSVINDARTFFRGSHDQYDAIVYGVLDSHILLSHGSNVRVDSFVYTAQGLADAYAHLKPGGLMSVSFALSGEIMGAKIFNILKNLPGAGKPVAVYSGYDGNTTSFMVSKNGEVKLPIGFITQYGLKNVTDEYAAIDGKSIELPTDDWPFFYMDYKMYPTSYIVSLAAILILSIIMFRIFLPTQRWQPSLAPFFFLGGGFMLTETKAITELGLIFGNTWHVVGIAIISVLIMAFLANLAAEKFNTKFRTLIYLLLFTAIALGFYMAKTGTVDSSSITAKLLMVMLLTSPLFFSGIIFSSYLKNQPDISTALAYNLMGAMLGGLLEYNSMRYGFASLYIISLALYIAAFVSGNIKSKV